METTLTIPEKGDLQTEGDALVQRANALAVTTQEEYESAGEFGRGVAALEKRIKEHYAGPKKAANDAHKAIVAAERELLEPVSKAKRVVGDKMSAFTLEQERLRRQEEERLRREEEERRAAEKAAEDERLERAAALEAEGKTAEAEAVLETPEREAPRAPVAPPRELPKASGVAGRKVYKARVRDRAALLRAVVEGKVPDTVVKVDEAALNRLAAAMKTEESPYPGVEFYTERSTAFRS